ELRALWRLADDPLGPEDAARDRRAARHPRVASVLRGVRGLEPVDGVQHQRGELVPIASPVLGAGPGGIPDHASVANGKWGPCCSVAPNAITTVSRPASSSALTSGHDGRSSSSAPTFRAYCRI